MGVRAAIGPGRIVSSIASSIVRYGVVWYGMVCDSELLCGKYRRAAISQKRRTDGMSSRIHVPGQLHV